MSADIAAAPRLLHCFGCASGDCVQRVTELVAAFGTALDHSIVFAGASMAGAMREIAPGHNVHYPASFPSLDGKPTPAKLARLAQAMGEYDLVLTYDWGALNVAMAHTAFAEKSGLPPLIHHEIGFGDDAERQGSLIRNWYRRIALGRSFGLVVETERLEGIALTDWQQPIGRVRRIAGGIKTADFDVRPAGDALRGIVKRDGERWAGAICDLTADTKLIDLLRDFAPLPRQWHLVVWGEGPGKEAIRAEAARLEISHRVHLPGVAQDLPTTLGLLDIYVHPQVSDAFPMGVAQAMAAGLPILAGQGSVAEELLSAENRPLLFAQGTDGDVADKLDALADDEELRVAIGTANHAAAEASFDMYRMAEAYRRVYASALQREIG